MEFEANARNRTGMILPFEQHSISFEDITYSVDMPQVRIKPPKKKGRVEISIETS